MWSYMADPGTHADICPVEIESDPDADDHYCADHEDGAGCRRRAKYYCIALQSWSFFGAFCGIVYFATMLGFLVEGVQSAMARLKLGRNRVVEENRQLRAEQARKQRYTELFQQMMAPCRR